MRLHNLINFELLSGVQKNKILSNKFKYDNMYDISDVFRGFAYYQDMLYEKIIDMFVYEGLPETIPADALEDIILTHKFAGLVNSQYGLVAVPANKYGVGLYKKYEPYLKWATPKVKGKGIIGKDCAIIKNNSREIDMCDFIDRYARLLSDAEASINLAMVKLRRDTIVTAQNEQSAESYKAVDVALRLGQTDTVIDNAFFDTIKYTPVASASGQEVLNLLTARQNILKAFLQEIGVEMANDKRERLTTDEVNSNSQLLLFNISDMLTAREKGVESVNAIYGTNIKVKLNPVYSIITNKRKEAADNGQVENQ